MLRYLTKFLLDIAPPVVATVIGAFIVTHYINPKTDTAQPKTQAAESAPKTLLNGASGMAPRNVEQVAVKPALDEQERKAIKDKPAPARQAARSEAPRTEEKREAVREPARDATDLARAALDRLRSQTPAEPARPAPVVAAPVVAAPAVVAPAVVQPVSAPANANAVPATVSAAPVPASLPPPIVIAPQREAVTPPQPLFGDNGRPTPPADIPVRAADASAASDPEGRSLIGGIASAAKSIVDVVIPR